MVRQVGYPQPNNDLFINLCFYHFYYIIIEMIEILIYFVFYFMYCLFFFFLHVDNIKHTIHACGPCEFTLGISPHFPHENYPEIGCELWLRIGLTNIDTIF